MSALGEYCLDRQPGSSVGSESAPLCKLQPEMCASGGSNGSGHMASCSGHMPGDRCRRLAKRIGATGGYLREQNTARVTNGGSQSNSGDLHR